MTDCSYVNNMIKEKYKLRDSIIPTIFSSIIASIGILTDSNTVVAGSMLLSPLLGPITYLINDTFKFKNIKKMSGTMTILIAISMFNGFIISKLFKNKNFELFVYYELLSFISLFFITRILFDFVIGKLFTIGEFMKNYIWKKIVYCNSLGLLILLFNFIIAYAMFDKHYMTLIFIYLSLLYLLFSYFSIYFFFYDKL